MPPPEPDRPPNPQAFPIKLETDHPQEVARSLAMLEDELRHVKRRPTHWRRAVVAIYEALRHALAQHRPASFLPYTGVGQLTRMFVAVVSEHPELPHVRECVETIDRLRTTYITWGVTRWPIDLKALRAVVEDCLRVIRRLDSGRRNSSGVHSSDASSGRRFCA